MKQIFVGLGFVVAFAVAVTGLATLLNGLFGWRIALEGTEAPAETMGGVILLCLAVSITLLLLPFTIARIGDLLRRHAVLILPYVLVMIAITAIPVYHSMRTAAPYSEAHAALWKGDTNFFADAENLRKLKDGERERLFAESIRHEHTAIAKHLAATLTSLTGTAEAPNGFLAAYTANAEVLQLLIDREADLSYREQLTGTGIVHQIVSGKGTPQKQIQCIRLLHRRRMLDVDPKGDFGTTPLMIAAERGHTGVVQLLLKLGAPVRSQDNARSTALHKACDKTIVYPDTTEIARLEVIELLLKAGADAKAVNATGDSCRSLAERSAFSRIVLRVSP